MEKHNSPLKSTQFKFAGHRKLNPPSKRPNVCLLRVSPTESNKLPTLGADVELDLGSERELSLETTHTEKGQERKTAGRQEMPRRPNQQLPDTAAITAHTSSWGLTHFILTICDGEYWSLMWQDLASPRRRALGTSVREFIEEGRFVPDVCGTSPPVGVLD